MYGGYFLTTYTIESKDCIIHSINHYTSNSDQSGLIILLIQPRMIT